MDDKINHQNTNPKTIKKRVLFVITQSEFGGAQRFFYNLINNMDKEKYDVFLASGKDGTHDLFEENKIRAYKLKFLRRNINPVTDFLAIWELRKLIRNLHPDTLFLNSSKAGFVGSLATVFPTKLQTTSYKLKTIYRIGGWTFNDPWNKVKKLGWIVLEKLSARWKDIIIVNNLHDFEQAKKLKIRPKDKIVLVHNGIDVYKTNFLTKTDARIQLSQKTGLVLENSIIIGTIANLYPSKGLGYLIEASEHFKNRNEILFFIFGDGPEKEKLKHLIQEKGLDKKIFLLGQIPNAHQFANAFDIFVLPSIKEGFPWALIEAMTAKLPVIATNVGAVEEIIENEKNGILINPLKPEQIASKINILLNNEHLRRGLGIQAHQTVLFKFPLEKMIREIEQLL